MKGTNMNKVQEKLAAYVLKRTVEQKKKQATNLLTSTFKLQDKGTLTATKMDDVVSKLLPMILPKHIAEVKTTVVKYGKDAILAIAKSKVTKTITKAVPAKKSATKASNTVTKAIKASTKKTTKKTNSSW